MSSNKNGIGGMLERDCLECSVCRVQLEEARPDHAFRSAIAIINLPLGATS